MCHRATRATRQVEVLGTTGVACLNHRSRDAYPRRAVHLREPEGTAAGLARPPRASTQTFAPCAASGSVRCGCGRSAGGGASGAVLQLPDRARRVHEAPAAHRARGLSPSSSPSFRWHRGRAEEIAHARPRLRSCAIARRGWRAGACARPHVDAGRELHLPGQRPLSGFTLADDSSTASRKARGRVTDESLLPVVSPGTRWRRSRPASAPCPRTRGWWTSTSRTTRVRPPPWIRSDNVIVANGLRGRAPESDGPPAGWGGLTRRRTSRSLKQKARLAPRLERGHQEQPRLPGDPRAPQPLPQARAVLTPDPPPA